MPITHTQRTRTPATAKTRPHRWSVKHFPHDVAVAARTLAGLAHETQQLRRKMQAAHPFIEE